MFANRFTALADACSLIPVLHRNLLLSLAAADFYRLRWSVRILDEVERGIAKIFVERKVEFARAMALRHRTAMQNAFEEAAVSDYDDLLTNFSGLPDPNDAHVIAAAVKTRASVIITENLRHFPDWVLGPLDLEAKTADSFIADVVSLDPGRAVAAVRQMRGRFKRPEMTPDRLMIEMEARGLTQTVDVLREHRLSL